jgi:hypothetical protein
MDIDALYAILADVARQGRQITYTELSHAYAAVKGKWHEPHGSWDDPLGELNRSLDSLGWPALSAVVVLQATREPGGRFWGCSPNVPQRPRHADARKELYQQIRADVHAAPWPATFRSCPMQLEQPGIQSIRAATRRGH